MDKNFILEWYKYMGVKNGTLSNERLLFGEETPNKAGKLKAKKNIELKNRNLDDGKLIELSSCKNIAELKEMVLNFDGCHLKKTATNTVFGEGALDSSIMFIGEAPGAKEDIAARPFCGDSGRLFDIMLKSIGLDRNLNCYISNSVFWRPPANRKPNAEEINICRPFTEKHIELFNPKLLVLVGATALEMILGLKTPMSQVRKKILTYENEVIGGVKTLVIFHPAYLLRQPLQKREMWSDLMFVKKLLEEMEIKI